MWYIMHLVNSPFFFWRGEKKFEMNLSLILVRKPLWKHILKPTIVLQTVLCIFSSTYLFAVCDRSPSLQGIFSTPGLQRDICEKVLGQSSLGQIFV